MSSKSVTAPRTSPVYTGKGHPLPETLRSYQRGELPEEEQEKMRDHLVFCEDCSETLLDLATFFSGAPRTGRLDPDDLVEAWNDLVKDLDQDER
jgi:hypothetical protein